MIFCCALFGLSGLVKRSPKRHASSPPDHPRPPFGRITLPHQPPAAGGLASSPVSGQIKKAIRWIAFFYLLVPETGLEPAHLSALDPKSSVSAIPPLGHIWTRSYIRFSTLIKMLIVQLFLGCEFAVIWATHKVGQFFLSIHFDADKPPIIVRIIVQCTWIIHNRLIHFNYSA